MLPGRTEPRRVTVAAVQRLQHLLTRGVREREAEGEEGGGASNLRQTVSEGQDELVANNLKNKRSKRWDC